MTSLAFQSIQSFCAKREVDLVLRAATGRFELCLHGEYDGYSDFFSILVSSVEYLAFSNYVTVGGMSHAPFHEQGRLSKALRAVRDSGICSGHSLLVRDAMDIDNDDSPAHGLIVAEEFEFVRGADWFRGSG